MQIASFPFNKTIPQKETKSLCLFLRFGHIFVQMTQ